IFTNKPYTMRQLYFLFFALFLFQFSFGQIGFQEQIILDDTSNPKGINETSIADIDNDGDLDIFTSSYQDGKIGWNENLNNAGVFGVQKTIFITEFALSG